MEYPTSKGSDQLAHLCSLIRVFAIPLIFFETYAIHKAKSKCHRSGRCRGWLGFMKGTYPRPISSWGSLYEITTPVWWNKHLKFCNIFFFLFIYSGQRAKLVSNPQPKQPVVLSDNVPIPRCALMPPNANSAQMLVWRPKHGKPVCIIPPVWKKDVPIDQQVPKYDSKLCRL